MISMPYIPKTFNVFFFLNNIWRFVWFTSFRDQWILVITMDWNEIGLGQKDNVLW